MSKTGWLKIGVVGRAHGLRGHFFVSQRDEAFAQAYEEVVIGATPEEGLTAKVLEQRDQSSGSILLCDAFKDCEASRPYRGQPVWVKRSEVEIDSESEYLWDDLIGKVVVDESGVTMGRIIEVYNHGASDVVIIENAEGHTLDIALIHNYFDMRFNAEDESLKLVVSQNLFTDLWQKKK